MPLFNHITTDEFVAQYWQQRPLLARQSFPDLVGIISGDELAGLACEEEVESRLISGFDPAGHWQCRQGPFSEDIFAALPANNWTLLVQGVDQWLDNIRSILDQFEFLPRWRLEDIMASYAPIGGGVGPHFDYYDVFLIQVQGTREWRLGQRCDESTVLQDNDQVKLLAAFDTQVSYEVGSGDALYIPAGMAHWGRALSDDCITLSVGFRAPSEQEIMAEALEIVIAGLSENARYQDSPCSIDTHPNKINVHVQETLNALLTKFGPEQLRHCVLAAFGQLVTEPRYLHGDEPESRWTVTQIRELLNTSETVALIHALQSRLAFSETLLFVNGNTYPSDEDFSRALCDKKVDGPLSAEQMDILVELLNEGSLLIAQ